MTDRRWGALAPLRHRDYRFLTVSLMASMASAGVLVVALVWQVVALGGSAGDLGVVTGAAAGGMLATALFGGVLADRVAQRHILLCTETVKFMALAWVAVLALSGGVQIWHLAVAAAVGGAMDGLYYPAYSALLPIVLPAADLLPANGLEGVLRQMLVNAGGPALAGVVVAAFSPAAALAMAAGATALAALVLLPIAPRPVGVLHGQVASAPTADVERDAHPVRAVLTDLREGFAYLRATPWLWATLGFASVLVLLIMGPMEVLIPFALKDHAGGGPGEHALVLAAFGVGGALASFAVAARPLPRRYLTWMVCAWGFGTLPFAVIGVADRVWVFVVAAGLVGAAFEGATVIWGTILQRRVPPELLGRVSSLDFFVSLLFMPVSMAIAAPVSHVIGLTATFAVAGLAPAVIAVLAIVVARLRADEIAHPLTAAPEGAPAATTGTTLGAA